MLAKIKDVFVLIDRKQGDTHTQWQKIGVAFVNKDDSLNVILDCIPINGKLHIRDRKPYETESK